MSKLKPTTFDIFKATSIQVNSLLLYMNIIFYSEYANRLADEGRFQQALQEIVDLFVSKYHAAKKSVPKGQNHSHEGQW